MSTAYRDDEDSEPAAIGSGRLAQNILHFARALREAGLPVGPGSVVDAIRAVEAAGIGTREDFRATLHAVFVKIARYFEARIFSMMLRKAGRSGHRTRGRQSGHPTHDYLWTGVTSHVADSAGHPTKK